MVDYNPTGSLPAPAEIEADDAIDESPEEFYARVAAERADAAARDAAQVRYQRDTEYGLLLRGLAIFGAVTLWEAYDARLRDR